MSARGALLPALVLACAGLWAHSTTRAAVSGQDLAENAGKELVGTPAPKASLKTIDGDTIDLGQLYGRQAVYVKFWATWCVPCREQMPHFEHVYETAGTNLAVVAVNVGVNDSVEEVRKYRQRLGLKMPIVIDDGTLAAAFHLRVTPQHIVIGRDGRVLYVGHLADARLDDSLVTARAEPARPGAADAAPDLAKTQRRFGIGDEIPATLAGAAGAPVGLRTSGQSTVLVFFSPWCESYLAQSRPEAAANCARMREQVESLEGTSRRVHVVGIALGLWATSADLEAYRREHKVRFPLILDDSGDDFRAFGVMQMPTALITDRQGRLTQRLSANDFDGQAPLVKAVQAQ
jgi:peroxiredoxin